MRCILLFLSFAIFSAGYSAVHAEPTTGFHSELHCYILSGKKFTRVVTARFVDYDWSGRCTHGRHPFRSSDCMRPSYATGTDLSCRLGFLSMSARGLSVFVVEDEPMIRIIVADMLGVLGHTIAAEAGHVDQALELAQSAEFDLAILDVNIDDKQIIPVADLIKKRGCPIIFATAYGPDDLPEAFRILQKPLEIDALTKAIDQVIRSRGP
jgi:CheY-like chemotaxis protein